MICEAQCYPKTVNDLKPILDCVARLGADHINLQPDVRPQRIEQRIPLLEGWRRLSDKAGVAVHIETHRDRMTTDLFFTLQLLDCFPDLKLTADLRTTLSAANSHSRWTMRITHSSIAS